MKIKYLREIQTRIDQCELLIAQKKILRCQAYFKFKVGGDDALLYYSILLQLGSYKLIKKMILTNLDTSLLQRDNISQDTILKLIILAHVKSSQGAYKTSIYLLTKIDNPEEKIISHGAKLLLFKSLHWIYLFNGEPDKCLVVLEKFYRLIGNNKRDLIFYYCEKAVVDIILGEFESAQKNLELAAEVIKNYPNFILYQRYLRFLQFTLATFKGELDHEGYIQSEELYASIVNERFKLSIKSCQLKYYFVINNQLKVMETIEEIYSLKKNEGTDSIYLDQILNEILNHDNYVNPKKMNFSLKMKLVSRAPDMNTCIEWSADELVARDYLSVEFKNNQIDLMAGVINSPNGVYILTDLQQKCLFHLISSWEKGINWLSLSEQMYDVDLDLDKNFENVRKIVTTLRLMNLDISYKSGRYFFRDNVGSIIFKKSFSNGEQLFFVERAFGKDQFTAEDVSRLFGLKKSRTSEYLRKWVSEARLSTHLLKGNHKKYQIVKMIP